MISYILLQKFFDRLVNALGIQTVLLYQSSSGTGLTEDILHADLLHRHGMICAQTVADSASQSANDGMLFHGDYLAGLLRAVKDDLLIERFDGADIYNLCATMVTSLPSRTTVPLPISK